MRFFAVFLIVVMSSAVLAQGLPMQLTPQAPPQTQNAPGVVTPGASPAVRAPLSAIPARRGVMSRPAPFTPAQMGALAKINSVYNTIKSMSGTFVQAESSGERATGKFFITKPGKVRFKYDAPSTLDIASDGQQLVVRDKKLGTQDVYQLWQTPLRYLLKDQLNLYEDARITAIFSDENVVTVTIEEEGALTQGKLTLFFSASDYTLQQWTTVDGNGISTNVVVSNVQVNTPNSPALFAL